MSIGCVNSSPLVRNLDRKFLDEFVSKGRLLLRPLSHFAQIEDAARRDEMEGARHLKIRPEETIVLLAGEVPPPDNIKIRGVSHHQPAIQMCAGAKIDIGLGNIPPAYVFCVSEVRLYHFGDAAFSIIDPNHFGRLLLRALRKRGEPITRGTIDKVSYGGFKKRSSPRANLRWHGILFPKMLRPIS